MLKTGNKKNVIALLLAVAMFATNPFVSSAVSTIMDSGIFSNFSLNSNSKQNKAIPADTDPVPFVSPKLKQAVLKNMGRIDKDYRIEANDLTYGEVKNINFLNLSGWGLKDADLGGLEFFTGLIELNLSDNQLEVLDFSNYEKLTTLNVGINYISSIKLPTVIESLKINNNDLSTLDLSTFVNLNFINASDNELDTITLPLPEGGNTSNRVLSLSLARNDLKTLDLTNCGNLQSFNIANNNISGTIDFSSNTGLTGVIDVSNNMITSLLLSNNLPLVTELKASNNKLSTINVSGLSKAGKVHLSKNQISSIDFSSLVNNRFLRDIDLSYNDLSTLDVSTLINLVWLNVSHNRLARLDLTNNNAVGVGAVNVSYNQLVEILGHDDATDGNRSHNFLPGESTSAQIQLIGSEKKLVKNTKTSIDNSDFYVIYDQNDVASKSYAKLSDAHQIELVSQVIVDPKITFTDEGSNTYSLTASGNSGAVQEFRVSRVDSSLTNVNANLYSYSFLKADIVNDDERVTILDDNFKQALIAKYPDLSDRDPSAKVRDITYGNVKRIVSLDFNARLSGSYNFEFPEAARIISGAESLIGISYFDDLKHVGLPFNMHAQDDTTVKQDHKNALLGLDLTENPENQYVAIYNSNISKYSAVGKDNLITQLHIPSANLSEIDLSQYSKLTNLNLTKNNISNLDISKSGSIVWASLNDNKLENIKFPRTLLNLERIYLDRNKLTSLNLSSAEKLIEVSAGENRIKEMTFDSDPSGNGHAKLISVVLYGNRLSSFDPGNSPKIETLSLADKNRGIDKNNIKEIDLSKFPNLYQIQINNNKIRTLDVTKNPKLTRLDVPNETLVSERGRLEGVLDLSKNVNLHTSGIDVRNHKLTEIIMPDISANFSKFHVYGNDLSVLDTKNISGFRNITFHQNEIFKLTTKATLDINQTYWNENFLDGLPPLRTQNKLRFVGHEPGGVLDGRAYLVKGEVGKTIDLTTTLGYDKAGGARMRNIATNKGQRFTPIFEDQATADMFTITDSGTITPKSNATGKIKVRVTLGDENGPFTNSFATTRNYIEIDMAAATSEVELKDGNSGTAGNTDIYLYRFKDYRDTGYSLKAGSAGPIADVQRKVTKVGGVDNGKSFMIPKTTDHTKEVVKFFDLAKGAAITDIIGEYQIEYYVSDTDKKTVRKLFVLDQIGDINADGKIDYAKDPNTNKPIIDTDGGLFQLYLSRDAKGTKLFNDLRKPKTVPADMEVVDVNGDGIVSQGDATAIRYACELTDPKFRIIQKYSFLIPETIPTP